MERLSTIFAFLLIVGLEVRCLEKVWLGNVDWENPVNWLGGRLPELDSRLSFPLEMRHAVGLPRRIASYRFAGVELPLDGIIALSENGKITVSEKSAARGPSAHWTRETPFFWVDPDNWRVESEAVPHLERLPCQSDVVVLPAGSRTFSARLPAAREIEVLAVRLEDDNASLARWEWRAMGERAEFLGTRFSVRYSPLMGCENCPCQEGDLSQYWEEICNVHRPKCGFPSCEYPLKVEGHCCYYCGGRIRLSKKALLSTASRVARNVLKGYESTLFWHSRVTSHGHSEILITEKGTYGGLNTLLAITDVKAALREEGVEVLFSESSGDPMYDYRLAVALGPFLGGFFALLLLLLLLFPVFGYSYSQVWDCCRELGAAICVERRVNGRKRKSFAFARFENLFEGNVQLAEEELEEEEEEEEAGQSASGGGGGERFENPLYRPGKSSKGGKGGRGPEASSPLSLAALEKAIELDHTTEDIEMDIENL